MAKKGGNIFQRILQLVLDRTSVEKTKRETQDGIKGATDPKVAQKNLGLLGKSFESVRLRAIGLITSLVGAVSVLAALRKVKEESIEAQRVAAQQEAVLRSTGMAAGRTAQQLNKQADALQKVTTFSDETVASAQNLLLTFTKIRGENFDQAVETTLDLATALGTDATTAALQLGKALQDPITGITALRRAGVSFSESQREMIKELVETNRLADAQRLILKELEVQFGGSAEAARNTLGGALEGLGNAWGELFEVQREGTSDTVDSINKLTDLIGKFDEFAEKASARLRRFAEQIRNLIPFGGGGPSDATRRFLDERRQQVIMDAAAADARARQLEEEEEARREMAEAEAERQKAAREAAEAEQRAQESAAQRHIALLIEAHELGLQSEQDAAQLRAIHQALFFTLNDQNLALERRVQLTKMLKDIEAVPGITATSLGDRPSMLARMQSAGALNPLGSPQAGDVTAQARTQAQEVQSAWGEAFASIASEGEALALILGEVMAGTGETLTGIIQSIAPAKAKENFVRAIEAAGAGLARLVLYGDAAGAAAGAKAAALHTAAGIGWRALGGGGGGGGAAGGASGFAGFSPGRGTPGASFDRSVPQPTTIVNFYVDPFDPRNGVHQQKIGLAQVLWNQRSGGDQ